MVSSGRRFASAIGARRWDMFVVGTLLAGAAVLRLFGLPQALPYLDNPDETVLPEYTLRMFQAGTLNPAFFRWGSLSFDLQWVVTACYDAYRNRGGGHTAYSASLDQPALILWGRWAVAVVSTLTVVPVYVAGRVLFRRVEVGLLAGALVVVSPLAVEHAHYLTPDSLATLCGALSLACAAFVYRRGGAGWYVAAGIAIGLTAAAKYNLATVALAVIAAHLYQVGVRDWRALRWLGLSAVAALITFVCAEPYALLDFPAFWNGVLFEVDHYSTGHNGEANVEGDSLMSNLRALYTLAFPLPSFVAVVAGFCWLRRAEVAIVAVFPVAAFLLAAIAKIHFDRNMLPLVPGLALMAAWATVACADWLWSKTRRTLYVRWGLLIVAAIVVVAVPAWNGVSQARYMTLPDTRVLAGRWIAANIPRGASVALDLDTPYLPTDQYSVTRYTLRSPLGAHPREWYASRNFRYYVASSYEFKGYDEATPANPTFAANYRTLLTDTPLKTFAGDGKEYAGPTIKIYALSPG